MDMEVQREQFKMYAKRSADICAAVSTVAVWVSIAAMCIFLGGTTEPPMVAGTLTTVMLWSLRKMES